MGIFDILTWQYYVWAAEYTITDSVYTKELDNCYFAIYELGLVNITLQINKHTREYYSKPARKLWRINDGDN